MRKRALRAKDEVGESREMHVHPNMSIAIHRQKRPASTQQLPIQHLLCEFSHPKVRFQGNDAHLEEEGLEGMEGEVRDYSVAPAKSGGWHHRPSDTSGTTLGLTLCEYAANVCQVPQCTGTRQKVRAYTLDKPYP